MPAGVSTWQFNFPFDTNVDDSDSSSIELLRAVGLNFEKHKTHGIDTYLFGEHMFTAGSYSFEKLYRSGVES